MSSQPTSAPVLVEDVFVTDTFLIKGRLAKKYHRLSTVLEDWERLFLPIEDATMVSLRGGEVIRTPSVMVNRHEVVFAHELVDFASDYALKRLATNEKNVKIRAFYNGSVQMELAGLIEPHAYDAVRGGTRRFFVMTAMQLRGVNLDACPELSLLRHMPYAIVQRDKLSYIYDFS
ncbi:MAG: hypothetical protein IT458_05145 [Planctomycetes bacterium]|nr:hypothetical protein [Planctomycetota bacterium]